MSGVAFVASRPPYGAAVDPAPMARLYGLTAAEVRMRLLFPLPELWSVCATQEEARGLSDYLTSAGIAAWVVSRHDLDHVPPPLAVATFQLEPDALLISERVGGTLSPPARLPWTAITHMILMHELTETAHAVDRRDKPKTAGKGLRRAALAMDLMAPGLGRLAISVSKAAKGKGDAGPAIRVETARRRLADVYANMEGRILRGRFAEGSVSYTGLGGKMAPVGPMNWQILIEELTSRLPHAARDARAINHQPRSPMLLPTPPAWEGAPPGRFPSPIDLYSALMFLSP